MKKFFPPLVLFSVFFVGAFFQIFFSQVAYAAQSCDSNHLNLCTTQAQCEAVPAYWYNNQCNATPTCDSANLNLCTTQIQCEAVPAYWWSNNTCNATQESTATPTTDLQALIQINATLQETNKTLSKIKSFIFLLSFLAMLFVVRKIFPI